MSTPLSAETGIPDRKLKLITRKEQRYLSARLRGDSQQDALRFAGLPSWMRTRELPQVEALVAEATIALNEIRYEQCLIDAAEIHEYLTDAIRANWSDIENDDGTFKPLSEWPEIWQRMKEKGDVEVETESVRSHDGEDTEGRGGWESSGKTVRKVKIAFASKVKLIELAMKHKAVDAMVQQKQGDTHLHLHAEVTSRLQGALSREQKLIDVKPERE
jgi:hypothetical protein